MITFFRRSIIASFLVLSLLLNAALVVSEAAYDMAYGIFSNVASVLYDGATLSSSIGQKKKHLRNQIDKLKNEISHSLGENKKLGSLVKDLEVKAKKIQKQSDLLSGKIRLKKIEIEDLKNTNGALVHIIDKKTTELATLQTEFKDLGARYKTTASKVQTLRLTNGKINSELLNTRVSLQNLEVDLDKSTSSNTVLSGKILKTQSKIQELTALSVSQSDDLKSTNKLVKEATDKVTKRIGVRVTRNIAAMPTESVPIFGIAATAVLIGLEIKDACDTMTEFNNLTSKLGIDGSEDEASFCTDTQEYLTRLISSPQNEFQKCVDSIESKIDIDSNEWQNCLPEKPDLYMVEGPEELPPSPRPEL